MEYETKNLSDNFIYKTVVRCCWNLVSMRCYGSCNGEILLESCVYKCAVTVAVLRCHWNLVSTRCCWNLVSMRCYDCCSGEM